MKGKVIALHSSRGGTGKTTIATNLAVDYAREGMNVALLDLDFRAPSLFGVFSNTLKKSMKYWLNDFMLDRCTLEQTLFDASDKYGLKGELFVGLANPDLEAIRNMMGRSRAWEVAAAKKLFSARASLFGDMDLDYCILDTSPGIQYSSINGVVSSDVTVIVATLNPVDLKGVKNMLKDFYNEFDKKSVILLNKVFPQTRMWSEAKRNELTDQMEKDFEHTVIGTIPCYCDVLEAHQGLFLVVEQLHHPFLKDLQEVAKKLEGV